MEHGKDALLELSIVRVLEPGAAAEGILGVQRVAGGTVVDDEHLINVPSQPAQILYIHSLELQAVLTIQTEADAALGIEKVNNGVGILERNRWS